MRPSDEWTASQAARLVPRPAPTGRGRLRSFFEAFALRDLLGRGRGDGPCRRCGGPRPDGALSLVLDVGRRPSVCRGCGCALGADGHAAGRLLPSGEVVLAELVLIERG